MGKNIKKLIAERELIQNKAGKLLSEAKKCRTKKASNNWQLKYEELMSEVDELLSDIEKINNEILNSSGPLDLPKEAFEHVLDDLDNSSTMKQFYERGDSYNDHKLSPISSLATKLVIVGTITPENNHGYYYTSDKNDMYQILDNNFGTNMHELKDEPLTNGKADGIIDILYDYGLGFIDVFSMVIRKKNSASDDDIIFGTLDDTAFADLNEEMNGNDAKTILVANSQLAFKLCKKILKRNNFTNLELHKEVCSIFTHKINEMSDKWGNVFKQYNICKNNIRNGLCKLKGQ